MTIRKYFQIRQKPAKPLYFGKTNDTIVFGLPGNPASVLTSFYAYVKPFLSGISGTLNTAAQFAILDAEFRKKAGLTHFLKGFVKQGEVSVLPGQESYKMDAFAYANCLIEIPENTEMLTAGSEVKIIPF